MRLQVSAESTLPCHGSSRRLQGHEGCVEFHIISICHESLVSNHLKVKKKKELKMILSGVGDLAQW